MGKRKAGNPAIPSAANVPPRVTPIAGDGNVPVVFVRNSQVGTKEYSAGDGALVTPAQRTKLLAMGAIAQDQS